MRKSIIKGKIGYWITLKDFFEKKQLKTTLFDCSTIKDIIDNQFTTFISKSGYYYDGVHSNNLWQLIFAKYRNQYIGYSFKPLEEITNEEFFDMIAPIFERIQETYPKYDVLLTKLADTKDLFAPLKNTTTSEGTSKFNDTPQIAGGFEDDKYASNYTKNNNSQVSESDGNTIMARIMEVDSNYKNILENWTKSFYELFVEESNVYEIE